MKNRPMFWLFLVSWTIVHLNFEYSFWLRGDAAVFTKYAAPGPDGLVPLAENVYFTKATWMFVFVWLQVLRFSLPSAMAWSFLLYSIELLLLFPFRIYSGLNLLLAVGMVIEDLVRRREQRVGVAGTT